MVIDIKINKSKLLYFLDKEPIKREEYATLMWSWRPHNLPRGAELTEDQPKYWEHLPLLPIAATLILTFTVFLLLIFQRNPSLVAGIVAAGLIIIVIYLFLSNLHEHRLTYE